MSFVSYDNIQIGQSCDFWRAYGLFVARVESFVCKPYAQQKSFEYHYYQYTRPNRCLSPSFD